MDEGDVRPISSTPCLFKVLEDFTVTWLIDDAKGKIDPDQFGCLKGTSTTYCLLDMIHTWLSYVPRLTRKTSPPLLFRFLQSFRSHWVQCIIRDVSRLRRPYIFNTVDYKLSD